MKRKAIIIIIVLISLCAAVITAQHFSNIEKETTTAPVELTEAPQTAAPTEGSTEKTTAAETERPQTAEQTEKSTEKPTQSTSKIETTKPLNTTTTTKPQTTATTATTTAATASTTTTKVATTTTTTATTAATEATAETKKQKITITISINCNAALDKIDGLPESGYFLAPCKYTAAQGDTVFDVLEAVAKENGISLKYQSKSYIQAINGLAEKACGGASGWTYKVNGIKPNRAATKYELSNGDIIEWCYAISPND